MRSVAKAVLSVLALLASFAWSAPAQADNCVATASTRTAVEGRTYPLSCDLNHNMRTVAAATAAGSAIIGKVGIDQTTDGVTNRVATPFTKQVSGTFTFTPAAAYASAGLNIQGVIDIAGLPPSTLGHFNRLTVWLVGSNITAFNGYAAYIFPSTPAATITDGSPITFTTADGALRPKTVNLTAAASTGSTTMFTIGGAPLGSVTTDSSGHLKLVLVSSGNNTITLPGVANGELEFLPY